MAKEIGIRSERSNQKFREYYNLATKELPAVQARVAEMERPAAMWQETERFLGQHGLDLNVMGEALTMVAAIRSEDPRVLEPAAKALEQELGATLFDKLEYQFPDRHNTLWFWLVENWEGEPWGKEGQPGNWVELQASDAEKFPPANEPVILRLVEQPKAC